jgi:hypothetical protein
MAEDKRIIGWRVDREQRVELLQQFPPRYETVVADHVTLESGTDAALPDAAVGEIIGRADDGDGVEALVVAIEGSTDRPGGGTYHITWSLSDGREARESNDVIDKDGWVELDLPEPVTLHPAEF